jgi:hypothetical protein
MIVHECVPPVYESFPDSDPLIFLAGPIQGATDWQRDAVNIFKQVSGDDQLLRIANPRREELDKASFNYAEQVAWEKQHLHRAAKHGAIIFWFAARDIEIPYEKGRAYAQTTRFEFGRAFGWLDSGNPVQLAIGIEPGYKGSENYIKLCATEYSIPVFSHLEDVCLEAVRVMQ